MNQCLQYTAANGQIRQHGAIETRRQKAYRAYQITMQKIDPGDKAVAKDRIKKMNSVVEGLHQDATRFKRKVKQAIDKWNRREPEFADVQSDLANISHAQSQFPRAQDVQSQTMAAKADMENVVYHDDYLFAVNHLGHVTLLLDEFQKVDQS